MPKARVTRDDFLVDSQGRTFADVVHDPEQPFEAVIEFFNGPVLGRTSREADLYVKGELL